MSDILRKIMSQYFLRSIMSYRYNAVYILATNAMQSPKTNFWKARKTMKKMRKLKKVVHLTCD